MTVASTSCPSLLFDCNTIKFRGGTFGKLEIGPNRAGGPCVCAHVSSLHVARKLRPGKPVSDERGAGSYGIYMYTTSCACMHARVSVCANTHVSVCVWGICVLIIRVHTKCEAGSLYAGCLVVYVESVSNCNALPTR